MSEHEMFGFKKPYQEQPNIKKLGRLAGNILSSLWAFRLDIQKIATKEEDENYQRLIGELDIFLFDLFEQKNCQVDVNLAKLSLSDQVPHMVISDSSSSEYEEEEEDIPSDDFADVKDLRK